MHCGLLLPMPFYMIQQQSSSFKYQYLRLKFQFQQLGNDNYAQSLLNARKRSLRSVAVDDERLFDCECFDCCVDVREIASAINRLLMEYCKAFLLYVDGYKYHEIAARLNIPIGTVKSCIYTVCMRLQILLQDYIIYLNLVF